MKLLINVVITFLVYPIFLYAEDDLRNEILSSIENYIKCDNQNSKDIRSIQELLNKEYREIDIVLNEKSFMLGSGDAGRFSGVTEKYKIIINSLYLKRIESNKFKDELYLHEALRAIGLNDENYELTLLIMLAKEGLIDQTKLDQLLANFSLKQNFYYVYSKGSGTSIGGGGDEIALELKAMYILNLVKSNVTIEKLLKALKTPIEANSANYNEFHVKKIIRNGKIIVLVPTIIYKYIPTERTRIEFELKSIMDDIL